ncbi:MAG: nitroreductase family deazaflavin-dependent oxidoreductase [Candidatus Lokiarchaeota archaeon]|nr:nitroreductase family deazaflavin-dependent oxidoreductase [Candidatus Lokiarchaeota archaeon]
MTNLNNIDVNEDLLPRPGSSLYNLNHKDVMIKNKTLKKFKIYNKYIVLPLYRLRILPLLGFGRIFLILTTQGRKTGKKRRTPLEYHWIEDIITIFSGRGEDAGWMKNIRAHPDTLMVRHGFHRFHPQVEFVTNEDQKLETMKWYVVNHEKAAKMLFGWNPKTDDPETTDYTNLLKLISIVKLHHQED